MLKENNIKPIIINFTYYIVSISMVIYILYIGSAIIIPFILAIFISLLIISISSLIQKVKILKKIATPLSIVFILLLFYIIWTILNSNIQLIIEKLPYYQNAIIWKINLVISFLKLEDKVSIWWLLKSIDIQYLANNTLDRIMSIFTRIWIITFYVLFILIEYKNIWTKFEKVVTDRKKQEYIKKIVNNIKLNLSSYFKIKWIVSLITGILSFIIMSFFNLDFALFLAFIIFILNFIPSVWSIIAVAFPIILSLVQFDSVITITLLSSLLVSIQILMWNIIEPKFMWNKLNLSPLAIILSLSFWWALWWIIWMLLSVPIMVVLNIILAQIPRTRNISIILSEKWDINIH